MYSPNEVHSHVGDALIMVHIDLPNDRIISQMMALYRAALHVVKGAPTTREVENFLPYLEDQIMHKQLVHKLYEPNPEVDFNAVLLFGPGVGVEDIEELALTPPEFMHLGGRDITANVIKALARYKNDLHALHFSHTKLDQESRKKLRDVLPHTDLIDQRHGVFNQPFRLPLDQKV